ncbi:MAG: STAS domain-containing protein [Vicinamibacteria bacterium]|nr:STAS domain-containing protein [Vicinamibacteria bacterium]
MDFREIKEGEIVMLVPDGSLVAPQDCAALERKMASVFEGKAHSIVLDCQKVGNVSGAALRILLLANRKLLHTGGRLVLCSLSAKVREAFSISGFDRDFVIAVNRTEAMEKAAEETIPLLTPVEDEAAASAPKPGAQKRCAALGACCGLISRGEAAQ